MSIIQEALKKAQVDLKRTGQEDASSDTLRSASAATPPLAEKRASTARITSIKVVVSVFVTALLLLFSIAAAFVLIHKKTDSVKTDEAAGRTPAQDISYAPIRKHDADQGKPASIAVKAPELNLSGIMYSEESPRAIINDRIVGPDDLVSGAKIKKINPRNVVLEFEDTEITLNLK